MDKLIIAATGNTPQVYFDGEKAFFLLKGKSYPENPIIFYGELIEYIDNYIKSPQNNTELHFKWAYYNSATSQFIVKMILLFRENCPNFTVKWFSEDDLDVMIEKGNELKEIFKIDLEIVVE